MIEVSAPGKIHLIGEHSICYGYPAIISAIDKRTRIKVEKAERIKIKNNVYPVRNLPNINIVQPLGLKISNGVYKKEGEFDIEEVLLARKDALKLWQKGNKKNDFSELFEFLRANFWKRSQAMLGLILDRLKIKGGGSLTIDSNLPTGVGLGTSASLSVVLVKAISELYNLSLSNQKINEIAFELEKLNHGRPSGGDNSACTFGGTIWFEKGKIEPLFLPDFLQNLIIVLTPRRKLNTGYFVQKVRNLEPNFRNSIMEKLGKIAFEMRRALENEAPRASVWELRLPDFSAACAGSEIPHRRPSSIQGKSRGLLVRDKELEKIKNLINSAQDNLAKLGISNPEIEGLVKEVRKIGGAAKISGGGGGTVICFHQDKNQMIILLKKLKASFQEVKLGAEGVKIEKK